MRDFAASPHFDSDDFVSDLDWLLKRLQTIGCSEVIRVDLSKTAMEIPVVRIVIPGLEAPHDDDTYLPGPRAANAQQVVS